MAPPDSDFVDLCFALHGDWLPRAYRGGLAASLGSQLPWIGAEPGLGVHRLNLPAGEGPRAPLSRRTRLTMRLPRARVDAARVLCGRQLLVGGHAVRVGQAETRELLPFHTLYAHLVAIDDAEPGDELAFQRQVEAEMARRGFACRAILGRHQALECGTLRGAPVMLDGLGAEAARRVMCEGLGLHRLLGCGVFVPHRSAAAVGTPT